MVIKVLNEFLPPAEQVNLGAIKVGDTLNINSNSVLNLDDSVDLSSKITNCFTEIPQNINLELTAGTLILKAGSKFYTPNGNGLYTETTTTSDVTLAKNSNGHYFCFMKSATSSDTMPVSYCYSGTTQPTITHPYAIWYDTANNKIKWTSNNGSSWTEGYSFPLCVIINDTPGTQAVTSIEKVFNGVGYIGSTLYVVPGVKGFIPAGNKENGILNNTVFEYTTLTTSNTTTAGTYLVGFKTNTISILSTDLEYNDERNVNLLNNVSIDSAICGKIEVDTNRISVFNSKPTFHAVDYTELSKFTPASELGDLAYKDKVSTSDIISGGLAQSAITNLETDLSNKVTKNNDITAGTYTKVTVDKKGLVTAGNTLTAEDIPDLTLSKITNVTATANEVNVLDGITASTSELNVLDGITTSTTELNYLDGTTSNVQTQLNSKLDKLTYEYNKQIEVGSSGKVYIGSFGVYETNITIEISSAVDQTYFGTLVIATQNYVIKEAKVYNDSTGNIAQLLYIKPSTSSDKIIEVYFNSPLWSKIAVHIKVIAPYTAPTHLVESISDIPSTATTRPTNDLDSKQAKLVSTVNIKTINNTPIIGSGNIDINPMPSIDTTTLAIDSNQALTVIGTKEKNTNTANYDWIGTLAQYNALGSWNDNWTYYITDDAQTDTFANKDLSNLSALGEGRFTSKQDTLVSGTNIKTVNNNSLLGSGNISITSEVAFASITGEPTDNTKLNTALSSKLTANDITNNVTSTATNKALSANMGKELQDQIDNLKEIGRFLSLWNCATGLPTTNPTTSPYTYHTGDYFIVSTVATGTNKNYKPDGSSYTIGVASTTEETETVSVNDLYVYDSTSWKLLINTQRTVTFANIGGSPNDNTNLKNALDAKQDTLPDQSSQSGKFLTTNGSTLSWGTVDAFPSQTGNAGKVLTTDGSTVSWGNKTFRGTFVSGTQYYKGDIVENSGSFFVAKQDNINIATNNTVNWAQISNANIVQYLEKSDSVERPIGLISEDASGNAYAGPMYFTLQNTPKINTSTGIITASGGIISKTEEQTENSAKVATTAWTTTKLSGYQPTLVSGTNIKTINNTPILGSGDITITSTPEVDNTTININSQSKIQTVGFIDRNNGNATFNWIGTTDEYNALATKDPNLLYYITDDVDPSGGNVTIDNISITRDADQKIQAIGTINQNNTSTAVKTWTGTRAQYDAITTKDTNTLYHITDDTDTGLSILQTIYPVGSIYITTNSTCPLAALFGTWELVGTKLLIDNPSSVPVKGNGKTLNFNNSRGLASWKSGEAYLVATSTAYDTNAGTTITTGSIDTLYTYGVTTDSSKSGIVADLSSVSTLTTNIFQRTA